MARYVVLAFDDNDKAVEFIKQVAAKPELPYTVEALTMKPTLFCECSSSPGSGTRYGNKKITPFQKGTKWGMWVCAKCKKPSKFWGQCYGAVISSARNLLNDLFPYYPRIWELPGEPERYEGKQFTTGMPAEDIKQGLVATPTETT
jgi:hypothetical protein